MNARKIGKTSVIAVSVLTLAHVISEVFKSIAELKGMGHDLDARMATSPDDKARHHELAVRWERRANTVVAVDSYNPIPIATRYAADFYRYFRKRYASRNGAQSEESEPLFV